MRWKPGQRSRNIEDRRSQSAPRKRTGFPFPFGGSRGGGQGGSSGGGGQPAPGGRRMGMGTILLMVAVFFFVSRSGLLGGGGLGGGSPVGGGGEVAGGGSETRIPFPTGQPRSPQGLPPVSTRGQTAGPASEEEQVDFVSFVLDDAQSTWSRLLPEYRDAKLVIFRSAVESACGFASAASGPFYCPRDEKVYIDLAFYSELRRRFGASGDFAQAYVLAHEIGHHVQKISGIEPEVRRRQRANPRHANELSVRMELQADCLAGVWGHSTAQRGILEDGDVEEGLRAAAAIGDDNIQKMSQGYVVPEGFTHGSSRQRVEWFRRGLESGDPDVCDTFSEAP